MKALRRKEEPDFGERRFSLLLCSLVFALPGSPQQKSKYRSACAGVGWCHFHPQRTWDLLCSSGEVWDHLVAKVRWEMGNSRLTWHGSRLP